VAVERRGRALAGLLERMDWKLEGNAASIADALLHALGEREVVPVARDEVAPRLCDADHGATGLQLFASETVVEEPLAVQSGHLLACRGIPPGLAAEALLLILGHVCSPPLNHRTPWRQRSRHP